MVIKEHLEQIQNEPKRERALSAWKWIKRGLLGAVAAWGIYSSVYTIPANSVGVVRRFGDYSRTTEPGIHIKAPFGVETISTVPVKKIQKEEFGFRTLEAGVNSRYLGTEEIASADERDLERFVENNSDEISNPNASNRNKAEEVLKKEYIMLTGDLNLVDAEWIVQYKIKDAKDFLFNVKEVRKTIRDSSQAIMRQLIGNGSVDEAITIGRLEYENQAKTQLQEILDQYRTGIQVVTVKMQSSNPPRKVRPAFNEVNKAGQQKEQRINEAMKTYNEAIPKEGGKAKQTIEEAKGYASDRVNRAKGDVSRFATVLNEYEKSPEVTRRRMYLETMGRLLPQVPEKWVIDGSEKDPGYMLKLLNLNQPENAK